MNKQESAALNMAKFIRGQTLLLLEKLDALDLDDEAAECEKLHEYAETLYQKLSGRLQEDETVMWQVKNAAAGRKQNDASTVEMTPTPHSFAHCVRS